MSLDIIPNADKNLLVESATKNILVCNQQIQLLKKHYLRVDREFPIHSLANFRDSFIHYEKLYSALLCTECECQKYAFDEHLQRCIKDACVNLANLYLKILVDILISKNLNDKKDLEFLKQRESVKNDCEYIFEDYPLLQNDRLCWTVDNLVNVFSDICKKLMENQPIIANNVDESFYWDHTAACLFEYYKKYAFEWFSINEINTIREFVHQLNNHILEIRSGSSNLVKSYQLGEKTYFDDFLKISDDIFNFMKGHHILGVLFFL